MANVRRLRRATWAVRLAFALVFVVNVKCALEFVADPGSYAAGFELTGVAGEAAVRGLGVAFLMWNATYPAAIASPERFGSLGIVILVQQIVGLLGETGIYLGLPAGHELLAASIGRFMVFDALGLLLMAAAWLWLQLAGREGPRFATAPGTGGES